MNPRQSPPHNPHYTPRHAPIPSAVKHADLVRPGATRGGNGRERQRKRQRAREKPDKSTECIYITLL
jgi:hypothetical protein